MQRILFSPNERFSLTRATLFKQNQEKLKTDFKADGDPQLLGKATAVPFTCPETIKNISVFFYFRFSCGHNLL